MTAAHSAAVARVLSARRERDAVEHALCGLRAPAATAVLIAHFTEPLPDAQALLERRADRCAEAHAEALRGLAGELVARPVSEPLIVETA